MSKTAYPIPSDVTGKLSRAGISLDPTAYDSTVLQDFLNTAQEDLETQCGRRFLAATSYTETLDGNGRDVIGLPQSCAAIETVVLTLWRTGTSETLVVNQSYFTSPQRTGADGIQRPIEWIRLLRRLPERDWPGSVGCLAITGYWGFNQTLIPDLVYNGIVAGACILICPEISGNRSGGAQQVSQGVIREEFSNRSDAGAYAYEFGQWRMQWQAAIGRYTRTQVGLGVR